MREVANTRKRFLSVMGAEETTLIDAAFAFGYSLETNVEVNKWPRERGKKT
jgi:hypothetical protein